MICSVSWIFKRLMKTLSQILMACEKKRTLATTQIAYAEMLIPAEQRSFQRWMIWGK